MRLGSRACFLALLTIALVDGRGNSSTQLSLIQRSGSVPVGMRQHASATIGNPTSSLLGAP
jgi:hypothetical protein